MLSVDSVRSCWTQFYQQSTKRSFFFETIPFWKLRYISSRTTAINYVVVMLKLGFGQLNWTQPCFKYKMNFKSSKHSLPRLSLRVVNETRALSGKSTSQCTARVWSSFRVIRTEESWGSALWSSVLNLLHIANNWNRQFVWYRSKENLLWVSEESQNSTIKTAAVDNWDSEN